MAACYKVSILSKELISQLAGRVATLLIRLLNPTVSFSSISRWMVEVQSNHVDVLLSSDRCLVTTSLH